MMRTYRVRAPLLGLVLALLPGCKSVNLYTTRAPDMEEAEAPQISTFAAGERPGIVVDLPKHCGWGRRVGTVWVEEVISHRAVWHQSRFMRNGSRYCFIPDGEGLKSGTYVVTVRAAGETDQNVATAWRSFRASIGTIRGDGEPVAVRLFDVQ